MDLHPQFKGGGGFGFSKRTEMANFDNIKTILMKEIERFFRPEFINRLDDVIVFRPLTKDDLIGIVEYETSKVMKRLTQQGMTLELDQKAKDFLIDKGYNPDYGARPLRRAIGQFVEDPLSEMLLQGEFKPPCTIIVTRKAEAQPDGTEKDADHLFFKQVEREPAPGEASEKPPETKPVTAKA